MDTKLSDKVYKSVEKYAIDQGLVNFTIESTQGSIKGDNYLGKIKTVSVQEKENDKKLNFIVKEALQGEVRIQSPIASYYNREIYIYSVVFKEFTDLQNEYKIHKKFDNFAKCVGNCTEENGEYLILENLKEIGFVLHDRKKQMDSNHVTAILQTYGKFHGMSFILKHLKPQSYASLIKNLESVFKDVNKEHVDNLIENVVKSGMKAVQDDPKALKAFLSFKEVIGSVLEDVGTTKPEVHKFGVVTHGDCWNNNFLFKYEGSKAPTDVRILDWQLSSVGSPILDLAYFFYTCSSDEVINNHKKYLDIYYNSLSEMIKQFGIDPNTVFSRNDFDNEWKKYAKFGLYMAIFLINITLADSSDAPDLSQLAENGENIVDSFTKELGDPKEFQRRVTNIVLHMVDNDLI